MQRLLIRNIKTLVSCDEQDTVYENVDLYAENGIIRAIGPKLDRQADEVLDASHMLCYPGLVNTHHHLYQQFSRNLPQVQNMELFDWLKTLYEIWKNLDENVIRLSSLTGMGELMKHGCTTCFDHHYVFPAGAGDLIGTQFEAASEQGAVLVPLAAQASRRDMTRSAVLSGVVLGVLIFMVWTALNIYFADIADADMPLFEIAAMQGPAYEAVYSAVLFMALCTTAVSHGFGILSELKIKTVFDRAVCAAILCLAAIPFAGLGFSDLIAYLYTAFGVLGFVWLGMVVISYLKNYCPLPQCVLPFC